MTVILILILGCFCPLILEAEAPPPLIRVAILRNSRTLEQAMQVIYQHEYQGTVRVVKNKQGCYEVINILDIEDFLLGVIGREMNPSDPLEALKAQAIAARSHAFYQMSASVNQPYDLVANLSQAYSGKMKLHKNVVIAIEATRGQILYHDKTPFPVYFHESCGGCTETVSSVWPSDSSNALNFQGVSVKCAYCQESIACQWKLEVPVIELQSIFQQAGIQIGPSFSMNIAKKTSGGHAVNVMIQSELGKTFLSAEKLRSLLGYSKLRSTMFNIRSNNIDGAESLIFEGNGYGHGVGL